MRYTRYSHLTDDELLRMVDARPKSPLIEELATRLEKTVKAEKFGTWTHDCPVCEAALNCTLNDDGDRLTLEAA